MADQRCKLTSVADDVVVDGELLGRHGDSHLHWVHQLNQGPVSVCRVDSLLPARLARHGGLVDKHVKALATSSAPLPPIIVHRPTMRVVDGMHRLQAALLRGERTIEVRWFDGDEADAFVVAVQHNTTHGMPLSLADRRIAAKRIIELNSHWSDRMIASVVNLATTTVRGIRAQSTVPSDSSVARLGIDGRMRRLDTSDRRRLAGELLRDRPESSLRKIAEETGLAPSTVLDVRRRIQDGMDPVPTHERRTTKPEAEKKRAPGTLPVDEMKALQHLRSDPALRFNESGRTLLRWLECGPTDEDVRMSVADRLPPHCLDTLVSLALQRMAAWQDLAEQLKKRSTLSGELRSG